MSGNQKVQAHIKILVKINKGISLKTWNKLKTA